MLKDNIRNFKFDNRSIKFTLILLKLNVNLLRNVRIRERKQIVRCHNLKYCNSNILSIFLVFYIHILRKCRQVHYLLLC